MYRVLFVDDERNVLDGLKRSLRQMRHTWDMDFVDTPAAALTAFAECTYDVVVSDMRMPDMDGSELLTHLMKEHPACIRIILSGHSDPAAIMKSVGVTHQYLAKPCESSTLIKAVERALSLRSLVESESVRGAVSGVRNVPAAPGIYTRLVDCLHSENASASAVADIISSDIALTARILQLVNSAFFGLPRTISNIEQAVVLIGLDTIGSLVLVHGAFGAFAATATSRLDVEALMQYSVQTAHVAKALAAGEDWPKTLLDQTLLAAMLLDIGKLVLAAEMPERFVEYEKRRPDSPIDSEDLEQEIFGATHAHVGAYLIGLWGLPDAIVEAIAYHESPSDCIAAELGVFGIVHVASRLARGFDADDIADPRLAIDTDYLARAGVLNRWPLWREAARAVLPGRAAAA